MTKGLGHHLHREKLRELELFSVEKRRFRGHLINMYKYLEGRYNGDGARLFSMMPSMDKSRWVQTETLFPMNIRRNVFTVRVTENWHHLPSKVVDGVSTLRDT